MRVLIQRVSRAHATENTPQKTSIAAIGKGMVILSAFAPEDSFIVIDQMVQKIKSLRIFSDGNGKMNLPGNEIGAEFLLVSQFTLFAECKYGNRPSFDKAAPKAKANELYDYFVSTGGRLLGENRVKSTVFGSDISVELVNDGPVTIWLDSTEVL